MTDRGTPSGGGVRRLLRRLRDIMAVAGIGQSRLDQVVKIVAADLVAEVCSIYLRRAGDMLELFATEGLKREAVHQTRLRLGEGLVGDIAAHARPLALADAQSHPAFAYRPETGEEIYHSLVGVPILRDGRVYGVLVVQNRTQRNYTEEEVETLETVAMVLAEMVSTGDIVDLDELHSVDGIEVLPQRLEGLRVSGGVGSGLAVLHQPRFSVEQLVAEDPRAEAERLDAALNTVRAHIEDLMAGPGLDGEGEHTAILEAYRMFADDRGWITRMQEAIEGGLTAEAAVQKVQNDTRARMSQVSDPYIRERLADLDDLGNRVLAQLLGGKLVETEDLPDEMVVIARSMGPSELLEYDRSKLRAVVLEEGSATAHVSLVARALNVPMLVQVPLALSKVESRDLVIVDADHAQMFVRPSEDIQQTYAEVARARSERLAFYAGLRDLPAVTVDGVPVTLLLNANLFSDVEHLAATGADGIGLFRTEFPFMVREQFPDVDAQCVVYRRVRELAGDKRVTFRTLDVGGDKVLPYWRGSAEENPAMGWRAIRIGLDRPAMLRQQLRAMIRAEAGRQLDVMFPMVAEAAELLAARHIFRLELERERALGLAVPSGIRVGVMLEVPSLYWQLPTLLPEVDFVSIGTNDLFQFLYASDRGNPRMSERYDVLSPGYLRLLGELAAQCDAAEVPVSVCGEMASQPLEAMALVGLGYRTLSMVPSAIGPIKTMIRSLRLGPLRDYLEVLHRLPDHSVREKLRSFAKDHKILI